jgi:hypothetical protein
MIVKKEVSGPDAIAYIEEHLCPSGKTVAELLLTLQLCKGKVVAYVPDNISEEGLFNFNSGFTNQEENAIKLSDGSTLVPIQNHARPTIVATALRYLESDPEHCCVYEDKFGEGFGLSTEIEFSHFGKEYYYLFSKNHNIKKLELAIKDGGPYYFLLVVSRLSAKKQTNFVSPPMLEIEQLTDVFENVSSFIVMAYDWESYLQWFKPGSGLE